MRLIVCWSQILSIWQPCVQTGLQLVHIYSHKSLSQPSTFRNSLRQLSISCLFYSRGSFRIKFAKVFGIICVDALNLIINVYADTFGASIRHNWLVDCYFVDARISIQRVNIFVIVINDARCFIVWPDQNMLSHLLTHLLEGIVFKVVLNGRFSLSFGRSLKNDLTSFYCSMALLLNFNCHHVFVLVINNFSRLFCLRLRSCSVHLIDFLYFKRVLTVRVCLHILVLMRRRLG